MPHDQVIVFKRINVPPTAGKLNARLVRLGSENGGPFERSRKVVVSGSFPDFKKKQWFYLIGKYEVTLEQFLAFESGSSIEERYQQFIARTDSVEFPADPSDDDFMRPMVLTTKLDIDLFLDLSLIHI